MTGIYRIINTQTDDCYIGSVYCIRGFQNRWNEHKRGLRNHRHHSIILQRAFIKYGWDAFKFEIIENIDRPDGITNVEWRDLIIAREQYYFDTLQPKYNVAQNARSSWTGKSLSKEHRAKISANHADMSGKNNPFYGKKHTLATKIKLSGPNPKKAGELNPNSKLTNKQREEILRLGASGISERQRAAMFGVSKGCIRQTDSHADKAMWLKGKHPTTKLDEHKVKEIKIAFDEGYDDKTIADIYSVNRKTINSIRNHKSWKHLNK